MKWATSVLRKPPFLQGWATWSSIRRLTASGVFRVEGYREHVAQVAQADLEVVS